MRLLTGTQNWLCSILLHTFVCSSLVIIVGQIIYVCLVGPKARFDSSVRICLIILIQLFVGLLRVDYK